MYKIVTDSCVDLPVEVAQELDIHVLPLKVTVNGKEYKNYLDHREITPKVFYNLLRNKQTAITAQANPHEFISLLEPILKNGLDVLYISFSSALSGTYNSGIIAKKELQEKYPERKIIIIDSLSASMGQGLLVYKACKMKNEGLSIDDLADEVENLKLNISHLFTVSDLGHLKRGGRLSTSSFILGSLISIKPLLHVTLEGKLKVYGKARGRFKSLHNLVKRLVETYQPEKNDIIFISHGDNLNDALYVRNLIIEKLGLNEDQFLINTIGPVIGAHSGVDTLAIFYIGNERTI